MRKYKFKKVMTSKDKENLRLLAEYKWPGKRAFKRLMKIAAEGNLEVDSSNPILMQVHVNCQKLNGNNNSRKLKK